MGAAALQRTQQLIENALIFIKESKSLQALAKMIGHDYQTYEHATKVLWFTVAFLRLNPEILEQIEPGYPAFEETGKWRCCGNAPSAPCCTTSERPSSPMTILNKTEPLTEVEWEIMKRHPLNGLAMLLDTDIPPVRQEGGAASHEDFHGGGYPMSLEGTQHNHPGPRLEDHRCVRRDDVPQALQRSHGPDEGGADHDRNTGGEEGEEEREQDERDQGMRRCFDKSCSRNSSCFSAR